MHPINFMLHRMHSFVKSSQSITYICHLMHTNSWSFFKFCSSQLSYPNHKSRLYLYTTLNFKCLTSNFSSLVITNIFRQDFSHDDWYFCIMIFRLKLGMLILGQDMQCDHVFPRIVAFCLFMVQIPFFVCVISEPIDCKYSSFLKLYNLEFSYFIHSE
jgi:hypothetical protein